MIGIGCAPAFLVCTVLIAKRFAPEKFAAVSGIALGSREMDLKFAIREHRGLTSTFSLRLAISSRFS
jgi:hypothetical protein